MLANSFRRIALAQGLLPTAAPSPPPGSPSLWGAPPGREAEPAEPAPEPCEERDDAA